MGVALNPKNGKLLHNKLERSGVDNIYAIGDVLGGKREHPGGQAAGQAAGEDMRSPLALSTCASRYGRATECSCYWLLNFPYVGVYPDGAHLLRPGGGLGHRADRRGGGVSPELSTELL